MTFTVRDDGPSLSLEVLIRPEIRAGSEVELPTDYPSFPFGMLPGGGDEYIVTDGAMKGRRRFFTRTDNGPSSAWTSPDSCSTGRGDTGTPQRSEEPGRSELITSAGPFRHSRPRLSPVHP